MVILRFIMFLIFKIAFITSEKKLRSKTQNDMFTQSYAVYNQQQDDKCVFTLFIPDIAQYGTLHIKNFNVCVIHNHLSISF